MKQKKELNITSSKSKHQPKLKRLFAFMIISSYRLLESFDSFAPKSCPFLHMHWGGAIFVARFKNPRARFFFVYPPFWAPTFHRHVYEQLGVIFRQNFGTNPIQLFGRHYGALYMNQ